MPRMSIASLSTVPIATVIRRLRPDASLPADVRAVFEAVVGAAPPEHFHEIDRICLTTFCQAAARVRRAERHLEDEGDVIGGVRNPWAAVLRDSHKQLVDLAPKLRVVPSARLQAKQARLGDVDPRTLVDWSRLPR